MALSNRHMEALIDIVENKLSDMLVWDGEDRKEIALLTVCLKELTAMRGGAGEVIALEGRQRASASVA